MKDSPELITLTFHAKRKTLPSVAQTVYNSQRAGITSAIVISILLPLGICAFCCILKLRENVLEGAPSARSASGYPDRSFRASAPIRTSTNSKIRRKDSDRDSGIQANGDRVVARERDYREPRYESDRIQKQAGPRSPQSSILKPSPRRDVELIEFEDPKMADIVKSRPPVTRIPSSGRSTPSKEMEGRIAKGSVSSSNSGREASEGKTKLEEKLLAKGDSLSSDSGKESGRSTKSEKNIPKLVDLVDVSGQDFNRKAGSGQDSSRGSKRSLNSGSSHSSKPTKSPDLAETHGPKSKPKSKSSSSSNLLPPEPTTKPPKTSTDESASDFDGVYYTQEPLNHRPAMGFPNTTLDADIDIKKYKTHGDVKVKPTQL